MQNLEKILEEIDREIEERRKDPEIRDVDICYGLNRAKEIIRKQMNNLKVKIHDECLEHESDIWDYVEMLGDQRVKNYETGEIEDLNLIIPILNGISDEVKRYKEYILETYNRYMILNGKQIV